MSRHSQYYYVKRVKIHNRSVGAYTAETIVVVFALAAFIHFLPWIVSVGLVVLGVKAVRARKRSRAAVERATAARVAAGRQIQQDAAYLALHPEDRDFLERHSVRNMRSDGQ